MYYFSKVECDNDENHEVMKFRHNIFKEGNEGNFHLINRRNKNRDEIIHNL